MYEVHTHEHEPVLAVHIELNDNATSRHHREWRLYEDFRFFNRIIQSMHSQ